MLEDFGPGTSASRGRFGLSIVLSSLVFFAISGAVFAASATVRRVIADEELVQVAFAPPPVQEPPPPPPPPPPSPATAPQSDAPARLGRPRPRLEQPTEIPDSLPAPRDVPPGPPPDPFAPELEGDPNGTADGVGLVAAHRETETEVPPPPPEPRPQGPVRVLEGTHPPEFDRETIVRNFVIPPGVAGSGLARITVVVRVTVNEEGVVRRVEVLRGHPLIPNENIVRAVERASVRPARMADGTPYAVIHTLPITLALTL